ncbi:MAG TPA: DUF2207 domain-containing protein, partial [Longimicrobiaceae bacterium]|nr:DUF2207 domain-containing protein [Longimicrobiaceae bacterium]
LAFHGRWNGIFRDFSLNHHTAQGRREKLRLEVVSVTDGRGEPLRTEQESGEDSWIRRLKVWVPGAHDAERTVVIRYRVSNAIRFFFAHDTVPDFDELYWNATGNDWEIPIERASARILLPGNARPPRPAVYTGYEGATERDAEIQVDERRGAVTFTTTDELDPGEGMTVAAGWPAGAVTARPTQAAYRRAEAMRLWPLGLPLLAFILALRSWRRKGKDPKAQSVVVGYEPPDGMTPAEIGTLIDHEAEMHDITATLVDLAVRGYVGIEEREDKHLLGLITSREYVFHLRKPREEWGGLAEHERLYLDALFRSATSSGAAWDDIRATFAEAARVRERGGELDREALSARLARAGTRETETVRLSELRNRFYKSLPGIRDAIYESLVRRGYYVHRPDQVKGTGVGRGIGVLVLGLVGAGFSAEQSFSWMATWALVLGTIASAIVLIVFGLVMPARTHAGARAREAALGFREFLSRVESDRYQRMITSPEMFERFLPHAMAFQVEERWAKAFDDLYTEPPEWYSGGGYGHFRASSFTRSMNTMSQSAGATMSSSPSSSGSGGGGSSGGGSGGGGGGGF